MKYIEVDLQPKRETTIEEDAANGIVDGFLAALLGPEDAEAIARQKALIKRRRAENLAAGRPADYKELYSDSSPTSSRKDSAAYIYAVEKGTV